MYKYEIDRRKGVADHSNTANLLVYLAPHSGVSIVDFSAFPAVLVNRSNDPSVYLLFRFLESVEDVFAPKELDYLSDCQCDVGRWPSGELELS